MSLYEKLGRAAFHSGRTLEDADSLSAASAAEWRAGWLNAQRYRTRFDFFTELQAGGIIETGLPVKPPGVFQRFFG